MSYRAGIGASYPTVYCDSPGCETKIIIAALPPRWFLDNKPSRGWYLYRNERQDGSFQRIDYCPHHKHLAVDAKTRNKGVTK